MPGKIKSIAIVLLIISSYPLKAQNYIPYYNLINKAEYAIYNGENQNAIAFLEEAFLLEKPHPKDCYLLAYCMDKQVDTDNNHRIKKLLKCASNSSAFEHWENNRPLQIELSKSLRKKLIENQNKFRAEAKPILDTIEKYMAADQKVRSVIADSIAVYYDRGDSIFDQYDKYLSNTDSMYQSKYLNYIINQGYPGIFKCGSDYQSTILLHIHPSLFEKYKAILFEELKKGNIEPFSYGSMVDRINCILNGAAYYYAYPLENCQPTKAEIINNRISIGMSPYFNGPRRGVKISKAQLLRIP